MLSLHTDTAEISCLLSQVCTLNRAVDAADTRARNARDECERLSWIMFAANLRATRTDTLRIVDTIVWEL